MTIHIPGLQTDAFTRETAQRIVALFVHGAMIGPMCGRPRRLRSIDFTQDFARFGNVSVDTDTLRFALEERGL